MDRDTAIKTIIQKYLDKEYFERVTDIEIEVWIPPLEEKKKKHGFYLIPIAYKTKSRSKTIFHICPDFRIAYKQNNIDNRFDSQLYSRNGIRNFRIVEAALTAKNEKVREIAYYIANNPSTFTYTCQATSDYFITEERAFREIKKEFKSSPTLAIERGSWKGYIFKIKERFNQQIRMLINPRKHKKAHIFRTIKAIETYIEDHPDYFPTDIEYPFTIKIDHFDAAKNLEDHLFRTITFDNGIFTFCLELYFSQKVSFILKHIKKLTQIFDLIEKYSKGGNPQRQIDLSSSFFLVSVINQSQININSLNWFDRALILKKNIIKFKEYSVKTKRGENIFDHISLPKLERVLKIQNKKFNRFKKEKTESV